MAIMNKSLTVYAGPTTSSAGGYFAVGSVSSGETVTVLFKETLNGEAYYYIKYDVDGETLKKAGYVPVGTVSSAGSVDVYTPTTATRYVNTTVQSKWGPSQTVYFDAVPMAKGLIVTYKGIRINNFALVEFTASDKKYRCFIDSTKLSTGAITKTTKEKFCSIAALEVGNCEKVSGSDDTKYGKWYGMNGVAWCAIFVCWCANFAGMLSTAATPGNPYVNRTAAVATMYNGYNAVGRIQSTPQVGDVAFFSPLNHVGIVTAVNGSSITIVEGNTLSQVYSSTYTKSGTSYTGCSGNITKFGR